MSVARTRCPNCGFEVQEGEECSLCGADLDSDANGQTGDA